MKARSHVRADGSVERPRLHALRVRIDTDMWARLVRHAQRMGKTRSEVVRQALIIGLASLDAASPDG